MAARDRYGGFMEPATTPLQRYIQNACDPQNYEPNLALNLEISDLINSKKGTAPREAAIAIVGHVNNRNPNVSLLALGLLDICVKNCGYPFHLQISTKEFLNELVRRFPERPPFRYSRVQGKILELIEEWRSTICQTSRYKEDLGFIRDMHRLLSYKGYTFPAVRREDAAVLNPSDNLRSAEEMEEEERSAQSAKLQELIRRGTPHDLQEANRLMKVMAGYDQRHKTDYRAKAAEEVGKVQQKAKILEEILESYKPEDRQTNEGAEELANALASAQPKIQTMCKEESDDHEAVAKLFEINDSIHRTLERYKLVKKGDFAGAAQIPKGTLGTSGAGVTKGPGNELSLIDFGAPDSPTNPVNQGDQSASLDDLVTPQANSTSAGQSSQAQQGSSLENDLLGLSIGDGGSAGGEISLGGPGISSFSGGNQTPQSQPFSASAKQNIMNSFSTSGTPPPVSQHNTGLSSFVQNAQPPDFGATTSNASLLAGTGNASASNPPTKADPFAALSSMGTGTSSFSSSQPPSAPASRANPPQNGTSLLSQPTQAAHQREPSHDEEWTFSSALPDQAHELTVTDTSIHIAFLVSRPQGQSNELLIKSSVSNKTASPVHDFTFQAAVQKTVQLKMEAQSSRQLAPNQRAGISQDIHLHGVQPGQGKTLKVRWRASYWIGNEQKHEQGEIVGLGIA